MSFLYAKSPSLQQITSNVTVQLCLICYEESSIISMRHYYYFGRIGRILVENTDAVNLNTVFNISMLLISHVFESKNIPLFSVKYYGVSHYSH